MKILVVGGGGREHTLTWKLVNDSCRPEVFCAPGNAGTAEIATYTSLTEWRGKRVLWYPDRKYYLLGKYIPDEMLSDMTVDEGNKS